MFFAAVGAQFDKIMLSSTVISNKLIGRNILSTNVNNTFKKDQERNLLWENIIKIL